MMLWGLLAPPRLGQQRHLVQALCSEQHTLDHMLLMPHVGSEADISESHTSVESGSQICLLRRRNSNLPSSGPEATPLCVCMRVCTHALEINSPMVPEALEQALIASALWSLE